jgi:hypothetical protein
VDYFVVDVGASDGRAGGRSARICGAVDASGYRVHGRGDGDAGQDNRCPKLATVQENITKWNQANDPLTRQVRFQFGPMDKISRQVQQVVANDTLEDWIFYFQPWPVQMRQERTFYYLSKAESNLLTAEKLSCLIEILGLEKFPAAELQMIWGDKLLWVYEHNWGGKEDRGGSDLEKQSAAKI